jgi:DNA excision repair protein ERCC-2
VTYHVAVRALTEFTAKKGDLDLRFTPSPTAQEGIAGHAVVTSRRPAGYQKEVALSLQYKHLLVRGRADGYDPERNRIEEIKTRRGNVSLERIPENHRALHWAQVKIYGYLLCEKLGLPGVMVALVYFDIVSQQETVLEEQWETSDLKQYFEEQCELFLAWSEQEMRHREARDQALDALRFPHADFRPGQRKLAESVFRAARTGRCLAAEAPTGIGKTIGTLFPLLKSSPGQGLDKIFYLAAKTSGRSLALEAVNRIKRGAAIPSALPLPQSLPLRVLELVARDKACEHPDKACHGESCPLAKGFYDRLPQARTAALAAHILDKATLRSVALAHEVCPYYLSQDLARWCDVVVGDYNYYFDGSAMLYGLANANQWRVGILVDEAHNLTDRARKMYTAELDQANLHFLRQSAPPSIKKSLNKLNRAWNSLHNAHKDQEESYVVLDSIPEAFSLALQQATGTITEFMAENPTHVDTRLLEFYFETLHFARLLETFDVHSLADVTMRSNGRHRSSTICIRNLIPAPFLKPRFSGTHTATLFSATLSPWKFYSDMLGLPEDTAYIDVESPFTPAQLTVQVADRISTRYQHREQSLNAIAELMGTHFNREPGNYLAFFSSFDYLQKVLEVFRARHPEVPVWEQERRMDEAARDNFVARFKPEGQGIGFAVLGGVFGEGIDLPGSRLIGAFIATLGLPQLNPVNEQLRERMQETFGAGYDYAYLYPGLQKVVQAAGRVIRTESDRGWIFLMDDRFARPEVRSLLPGWWEVTRTTVQAP